MFAPLRTALGIAPEANWPLLPASARPSRLWHLVTPSNTLLLTWRNALLGRSPSAPVSLQFELGQGGSADFRYCLSSVPDGAALPAASACGATAPMDRQVTSLGFASDLDALAALSPSFGLPVHVCTNAEDAAALTLATDVLLGGMNIHVGFEGADAPFAPCLRADIDRDGRLGGPDDACRLAGRPFRFWFNGDRGKGDHVGQSGDLSPNAADLKVNGKLDLVNLFPVSVDATPFARAWGDAAEVRLRADSDSLRYCVLGEGFSPDAVRALASTPVLVADGTPLESAALTPLCQDGVPLGGLADAAQGPVLIAFEAAGPVGVHEGPELVVTLGGAEVYRERLPVAIGSVDAMYRWVSLHGAECGSAVPAAFPGSCAGLPDSELSDGCVFFLHGFNVSEGDARAWNRAMFKRLWWAGSRARNLEACRMDICREVVAGQC